MLEREAKVNLEVMWLLGKLAPDFKTIADFRRDNLAAIKAVCREFTLLCQKLKLFGGELMAVDGSKFKTVNNRRRNFDEARLTKAIKAMEAKIDGYLGSLDAADAADTDPDEPTPSAAELRKKICSVRPQSKTNAGVRTIPLTPDSFETFGALRQRSELFGEVLPEHYCFASFKPIQGKKGESLRITRFDASRPVGSWKKAWGKVTIAAGLSGLRFHDLRHSCITELLSNPTVSVQTVKAVAEHVSQRMVNRYSHIGLAAKQSALEALSSRGCGTIHGTKAADSDRLIA